MRNFAGKCKFMQEKPKSTFTPSLLGSCLGVIVSFALIGLIIFLSILGSSKKESAYIKNNAVLHISLEGLVPEKTGNTADQNAFFDAQPESIGLQRICELIDHAATDPKIKGILLENNYVVMGQATLYTILQKLEDFKTSGKFIYSYADSYSQSAYLLSSVSDSIFLNPQGLVDLRGYGTMMPFFKTALDKLGIKMDVFYAGDFKSGSEPFRRDNMSEENKLQLREFIQEIKILMSEILEKNRSIAPAQLDSIMNQYAGRNAKKSLENNLVDVVCHRDEMETMLKQKLNVKEGKKLPLVTLSKYHGATEIEEKSGKETIAVVVAEGEISFGDDQKGIITKNKYSKIFQKILDDKNIKAVVLRVNSPGGDAFTSEVIWHYVDKVKAKGIPVIASFGDYAASGGYYIACGADHIFAQPNTLTGSIGVYAMFPNVQGLTKDKFGVQFDTVKTNELAVALTPFYELSDKERMLMQESVHEIYDLFLERVSTGRKLPVDSTKVIARGRVWTGQKALEIGLVDSLGNLNDAIHFAAEKASIEKYKLQYYPSVKTDFFSDIIRELSQGQEEEMVKFMATPEERKAYEFIKSARSILQTNKVQARLPFIIQFN